MYLGGNGHDTFKQDNHPAIPFAFYPHEHTFHVVKLASMDTYTRSFFQIYFFGLVIDGVLLVMGSHLDEAVHLFIRHGDVFKSRTFLPSHELKEVEAFLERYDLGMAGMYEQEARNDRDKPSRLNPVIDPYRIMLRDEIFQTVLLVRQSVRRALLYHSKQ